MNTNKTKIMRNKLIGGFLFLLLLNTANAQLSMLKLDDGLLIVDGQNKVLKYQSVNKGKEGAYARCNYIHPLYGIDGKELTEDFPADHLHHRGVFWTWHQVWIGDKRIGDPWEIKDFEQEVVELEFMKISSSSVQIKTEVDWKSPLWKVAGVKAPYLKEKAVITVHEKKGNYRKIDFEIQLLALVDDLKIGGSEDKKGYSGFSVRMALPEDIVFSGPNGEVQPEVTAVQSEGYINMYGSIGENKSKAGIVILDHPNNPAYPQNWILRKKNSMQNAVYPGNKTVRISSEKPLVLNYSLLVYEGKMSHKQIAKSSKIIP